MAVRLCVTNVLRKCANKTGARSMTYYPIDEHVFGLSTEQQQVSCVSVIHCLFRDFVYTNFNK